MKISNDYMNALKKSFSSTDRSIKSFSVTLNRFLLSGYADRFDIQKHNELLFLSNPEYIHRSFEDLALLEITKDLLKSAEYDSFDDFTSFIGFVYHNKYYKEMFSCLKTRCQGERIIAVEGPYSSKFSERTKKKAKAVFDMISLSPENMERLHSSFPTCISLNSGKNLRRFDDLLDEIKDDLYSFFRKELTDNYPDFRIATVDYYHRNNVDLENFFITIEELYKTFVTDERK